MFYLLRVDCFWALGDTKPLALKSLDEERCPVDQFGIDTQAIISSCTTEVSSLVRHRLQIASEADCTRGVDASCIDHSQRAWFECFVLTDPDFAFSRLMPRSTLIGHMGVYRTWTLSRLLRCIRIIIINIAEKYVRLLQI